MNVKARALASLAEVVTTALVPHLDVLLPALFPAIAAHDPEEHDAAVEAAAAVSGAVDENGVHLLLGELHQGVLSEHPVVRQGAAELVGVFCTTNTRVDMEQRVPTLLGQLLPLFADKEPAVVKAAWAAVGLVTAQIPKENLPLYVKPVREGVIAARDRQRRRVKGGGDLPLAGLSLPKALTPLLPVYLQCVTP